MRYKITFSYDGSKFNGYQKQRSISNTIQGIMEDALKYINDGNDTKLCSSGRTDKGVSAYMQVAHADVEVNITPYKLKRALNSLIPDSIHVIDVLEKGENYINLGNKKPDSIETNCSTIAEIIFFLLFI